MTEFLMVLGVVVVLPGLWLIWAYNRYVTQVASIDASWSGIDVELQRRHDLVDNLVNTVAAYTDHERTTLEAVTRARTRAAEAVGEATPLAEQARAEDALTDGLTRLLAISEEMPDLKADRAFRELQAQLVETEDRISASRRLYNLEVAAYERRRKAVPSNIVAWLFSFSEREMFEIRDASAQHAAQVHW